MESNQCKEEGEISEDETDNVTSTLVQGTLPHQTKKDVIIIEDDDCDEDIIVENNIVTGYLSYDTNKSPQAAQPRPKPLSVINHPSKAADSNVISEKLLKESDPKTKYRKPKKNKSNYSNGKTSANRNHRITKNDSLALNRSSHNVRASHQKELSHSKYSKLVNSERFQKEKLRSNSRTTVASGKLGDILQYRKSKPNDISSKSSHSTDKASNSISNSKGKTFFDEKQLRKSKEKYENHIASMPPLPKSPPPCPPLPPSSSLPLEEKPGKITQQQFKTSEELEDEIDSMKLDDTDYAYFLLDTYRDIKEKLDNLNKEEENSVTNKERKDLPNVEHTGTFVRAVKPNDAQDQDKTEVVDMELASTDDENEASLQNNEKGGTKENKAEEDDDDELDLLELRRAALASAALMQKKKLEESEATLTQDNQNDQVKISTREKRYAASAQKRKRSNSQRDKNYSTRYSKQDWEEKERFRRERDRLFRESERIRKAKEDLMLEREAIERERQNRHVREELWLWEIRRVLSIENQKQRYYHVMDLFDIDDRAVAVSPLHERTSRKSPSPQRRQHSRTSPSPTSERRPSRERKLSEGSSKERREHRTRSRNHSQSPVSAIDSEKGFIDVKESKTDEPEKNDLETSVKESESHASEEVDNKIEDVTASENDEEEDEEMLRAQLLASVAQRRREKEEQNRIEEMQSREQNQEDTEEEKESFNGQSLQKSSSSISLLSQNNTSEIINIKPKPLAKKAHPPIPVHKPVIIHLGDSSSDEDEPPSKLQKSENDNTTGGFFGSLDSFLKEARMSVEKKQEIPRKTDVKTEPVTPDALKHLGTYHVEEYKKLKEEIKKRESRRAMNRTKSSKQVTNIVVTVGDKESSDDKKENRIVEVEIGDEKLGTSQESTAQNTEESQDSEVDDNKETEDPDLEKLKMAELTKQTKMKQVRDLELRTELQRKLIEQDEQKMKEVRDEVHKKKTFVKTTEVKVQKLREQVQAAQRILKANFDQITKLNEQAQEIQSKMDKRRIKFLSLEQEMNELGRTLYGSNYTSSIRIKLQAARHPAVKVSPIKDTRIVMRASPKMSLMVKPTRQTNAARNISFNNGSSLSPTVGNLSTSTSMTPKQRIDEKARLQLLEKQYAQLIHKYKENQGLLNNNENKEYKKEQPLSDSPGEILQNVKTDKAEVVARNDSSNKSSINENRRKSWGTNSLFGSHFKTGPKQQPEHVETEETMSVSAIEFPEDMAVVNPRRKSLIGNMEQPLTRPNLDYSHSSPKKDKDLIKMKGDLKEDSNSSRESSPVPALSITRSSSSIPSDQHLKNLRRLHNENLSKPLVFEGDTCVKKYNHAPVITQQSISVIPDMAYQSRISKKEECLEPSLPLNEYSSHLLRFKSYRFSPYFRTKCHRKLTSVTHSNKIKAGKILCRFDLTGRCNHEQCPWQHQSDYEMDNEETLQDLAAYSPQLAGITEKTPKTQYKVLVSQYTELFSQQNSKMTTDEQCIFLASQINQKTKHVPPHTTRLEARKWKPVSLLERLGTDGDNLAYDASNIQFTPTKLKESKRGKFYAISEDDILCEQDVRYWMLGTDEVHNMETAVMDNPKDVAMWIKLAYKKLHQANSSGEASLDHALSVLSRALECNKDDLDLWIQYLSLYEKRTDHKDLMMLYKQALQYAPCYQLYWKHLKLLPSCNAKLQLCQKILDFLCSEPQSANCDRSHCILEITMYQISVLVQIGKLHTAIKILQDILKSVKLCSKLHQEDLVLTWLCFIHLSELNVLPQCLFDPSNSNPGHLVKKETFIIPWNSSKNNSVTSKGMKTGSLKDNHKRISLLFQDAISSCANLESTRLSDLNKDVRKTGSNGVNFEPLIPLYKNFVSMHLAYDSIEEARNVYKQMIIHTANFPDVWIFCADVEYRVGALEEARKILQDSMRRLPCEPQLIQALVKFELNQGNNNEALELLELCPFHFYQIDLNNTSSEDPNFLFCALLKQNLPLQYKPPQLKCVVTADHLKKSQVYLWLNYCLLLELQGFGSEVAEQYEAALSSLTQLTDVHCVWKSYLQYTYRQLTDENNLSSERNRKAMFDLVFRCLVSVPTKLSLPYKRSSTTQYWLDYSFHNDVLEILLGCLSRDQIMIAYEDYMKLLPANVELLIRAIKQFCSEGHFSLALGWCAVGLEEHTKCLELYKLYLSVASHMGNFREMLHIYRRAIEALPHSIWLWKNYLLFEATTSGKKEESVKKSAQKCFELGINVHDFVSTVLRF